MTTAGVVSFVPGRCVVVDLRGTDWYGLVSAREEQEIGVPQQEQEGDTIVVDLGDDGAGKTATRSELDPSKSCIKRAIAAFERRKYTHRRNFGEIKGARRAKEYAKVLIKARTMTGFD